MSFRECWLGALSLSVLKKPVDAITSKVDLVDLTTRRIFAVRLGGSGMNLDQGILGEGELLHNFALNQMFLDNSLANFRRHAVIPGAFWINHHQRPVAAKQQTVHFAAVNALVQFQLL